ncbi:hypothetical protein DXG01_001203 [Tephrocybe rancida]|nr:hypothetical protein DXG01_001203 [Tephrocybe rancida]
MERTTPKRPTCEGDSNSAFSYYHHRIANVDMACNKGYKHVFISPSSADTVDGTITTKSGNAKIHGMKKATKASIVYIATQVRFALSSAAVWSRSDKVTDSENFYTSLLNTLEDPLNNTHVNDLLKWWDMKIFPHEIPEVTLIPIEGSPLDRIRQMAIEAAISSQESSES